MKKNKDSLFKDLKIYNLVMTNIWQFLTIIAIGILAGYLFEKYATNQNINYMAFRYKKPRLYWDSKDFKR